MTHVVRVSASWCGSCRAMAPIVASVADEHEVALVDVDVETEADEVERLGVRAIPTLIAFRDGTEIGRLVGVQDRKSVSELFEAAWVGPGGTADTIRSRPSSSLVAQRAGVGAVVAAAGGVFASGPLVTIGATLMLWALIGVIRR